MRGVYAHSDGENVLDRTAVHPDSYPIVEKMAAALSVGVNELVGNKELVSSLKLEDFVTEGRRHSDSQRYSRGAAPSG